MNERLKTFYDQVGLDFENFQRVTVTKGDMEKFAELIVAECVSTLNDMHLWQSVNNQNYPGVWHDAVDQSINTIKEHFGVEE